MKQVHKKSQAMKLTTRCIGAVSCQFLQSSLKKIISTVLTTAVFLQFLLIPWPYTHNFSCGETLTYKCLQLVLLYYFAIKLMFKAFY